MSLVASLIESIHKSNERENKEQKTSVKIYDINTLSDEVAKRTLEEQSTVSLSLFLIVMFKCYIAAITISIIVIAHAVFSST